MFTQDHILLVVHVIWQIAGASIVSGLVALVFKALQHAHLSLTTAQAARTATVIEDAIAFAAEVAAQRAKAGTPLTAAQKFSAAAGYVERQVKGLSAEQISDFIHAALPSQGEGAAVTIAPPPPQAAPMRIGS